MKTYVIYTIFPLGAAALLGSCHGKKQSDEAGAEPVSVAVPMIDSVVLHQEYPATLIARDMADVVARVNGTIIRQCYNDGERVQAGQPLFIIESTTYRDAVNQAQGALETAIAEHDYAVKNCEAMKKALEADAVSKMDVNQAESNVATTAAAVKTARAQLETARTQLSYCTVRAPFTGRVATSPYVAGSYVGGEGAPVVLTHIYNDDVIYADFSVETARYMEVLKGRDTGLLDLDHVPVTFADSLVHNVTGKLIYESPNVSSGTGTVMLRLSIANVDGPLREGMYGKVQLPYAVDPKAMLVRDASISTDQLGKYLWTVNDSNKVVYTPIQVGELYQDTLRIVNSGITPSSRYVTSALLKVRDGMPVKPVGPAADNATAAKPDNAAAAKASTGTTPDGKTTQK